MKRLALALVLGLSAFAAQADPVEGVWKTQPGETGGYAHVKIAACGSALCGTIIQVFGGDGSTADPTGKRMIWDMQAQGGGKYSGGKIWAPDNDRTYRSKMALSGNSLKVSGCIGPICRGQTWARVN